MPSDNGSAVTIDCSPSGRNGKATLTARLGDNVLAVETIDLTKPKQREAYLDAVCAGRTGIDRTVMQRELLKLAADAASRPEPGGDGGLGDIPELDTASIVRPERFIMPELSGLAVPSMIAMGDKPVGRWLLYLQWRGGHRERRQLSGTIELPDKRRLWIHPEPAAPAATMQPGWAKESRRAWIDGGQAPRPADVFRRICERFAHFIDLPAEHAKGTTCTLALWSMLTYIFPAWPAVPYLFVGGPLGSGKSRVFEILMRIVFRSLASSNMTTAALFRTLHNFGGTLLLDEAERLKQTGSPEVGEILSMLLAGYKRGGQATRLEPVGDTFKTVGFDVYGPKALACIAGLPPALASRCIVITMFRAAPKSEKPRRRIDANPETWQALRDDLHALALEHGAAWLELADRIDVCPTMGGRDFELWQPLLALASWIEADGARGLLKLMQDHALATIDRGRDDAVPDADDTLLRIVADAMRAGERPTPHEILAKAMVAEPVVFKGWYPRTVTGRLKSYGIPKPRKIGSRREFRDITPEVLRRIQTSYGIDLDLPDEEQTDKPEPSQ